VEQIKKKKEQSRTSTKMNICHEGNSFTPSFSPSVLPFSHMNEDYQCELKAVEKVAASRKAKLNGPDDVVDSRLNVLCIASSGETALSLLTSEEVAQVDAVDLNPWQAYMTELRRTALLLLTRDEQLRLFAMDPSIPRHGDEEERKRLYAFIRPFLPLEVREKWDERLDKEITFGLGHVGQSEIINHDIQEELSTAGYDPLNRADRSSLPHDPAFVGCFQQVYSYTNFKKRFANLHIDTKAMEEMIHRHLEVLSRPNLHDNYFFHYYYTNYHIDKETGLPLYLQEQAQEKIRLLGATSERLSVHIGDVTEVAPRLHNARNKPYDVISISNILDWIPETSAPDFVEVFYPLLSEGGVLIARHETKPKTYFAALARKTSFHFDAEFNRQLFAMERSLLIRDTVAFIKKTN
jgi:S-adenosylmethionine:diacylglycerol 3-amino-3-carboxypropyl transferase